MFTICSTNLFQFNSETIIQSLIPKGCSDNLQFFLTFHEHVHLPPDGAKGDPSTF